MVFSITIKKNDTKKVNKCKKSLTRIAFYAYIIVDNEREFKRFE